MPIARKLMPSAPLVCFILVALLPATGTVREAPSGPTLDLHSLPPGPRPLPVTIGAYLIDLERIEEATGTYALAGYLDLEWRDPRLSREVFPNLNRTHISLQDIWWPNIEFFNQHEPRNIANLQLGVRDDGTVVYEERFRVRLGSELNFRRFPFDRQDLLLQIESFRQRAVTWKQAAPKVRSSIIERHFGLTPK